MKRVAVNVAVAAIVALAASGCGGSEGRNAGTVEDIAGTVEDLEEALDERDLRRVCDEIFSPEARRRAGGEECPRRLARTTTAVESPRLELVSVALGRDQATARVRASTDEQPPAIDAMRLVPAPPGASGYRIESLSSG